MNRYGRELSVWGVLVALLGFLAWQAPDFFQPAPLRSLLTREAPSLIVACGMAIVIITRQIDISVGSQFSVCSVVAGLLALHGVPLVGVVLASVILGALLGAINGLLVAFIGLPSIVVTLATMVSLRQALNLFRQGEFVNLPEPFQWFGCGQTVGQAIVLFSSLGVLGVLAWALKGISFGRFFYAVGSDPEAARLAGIRPRGVTFGAFVFLGGVTGLAAVMNIVQSPQVQPLSGMGLELKVIAAAVVGGVAIAGGRGNLWGVCAGLLLLACIAPAMTHLHVEAYWEKAIQGGIILFAMVAEAVRKQRWSAG